MNEEQLEAVDVVSLVLPRGVSLETSRKYGNLVAIVSYGDVSEAIMLSGFNKAIIAKRILNSEPVSRALE